MKEFDYDSLASFLKCPLRYKFKYKDNIIVDCFSHKMFSKQTLIETFKHFFKELEKGNVISSKALKDYWADKYMRNCDADKILYSYDKNKRRDIRRCYSLLNKFYRYIASEPGTVVAVDLDYEIDYMEKYKIYGNIDLVRENKDKQIEMAFFNFSQYKPQSFMIKNDIEVTMNSYAFNKIFKKEEDVSLFYHIKTNTIQNAYRNHKDYNKLLTIIDNVCECIDNEIYYPRHSYFCKQCKYNQYCTNWSG